MREKKKGTSGNAAMYITRAKALRKLQLSLADFRRLCIIKGIYPREPRKKVEGPNKTYYLTKDVQFLAHEPLLAKLREIRAFNRKIKRASARKEAGHLKLLRENTPTYTLDHVVRERYPTFTDAIADLDDALCLVHLFARLPAGLAELDPARLTNCAKLSREFQHYVVVSNSLRKCFVSIKGVYYRAEILGTKVTWLVPHKFTQELPADVDYRVMMTFLEFYECLLRFVLFKLYLQAGLVYPPPLDVKAEDAGAYLSSVRTVPTDSRREKEIHVAANDGPPKAAVLSVQEAIRGLETKEEEDDDVDEQVDDGAEDAEYEEEDQIMPGSEPSNIFCGLRFFLGRETPRWILEFVCKACGAEVGWEGEGSPFQSDDTKITHWISDRPVLRGPRRMDIEYVQPQWVFDSLNAVTRLPPALYGVGVPLPPHLSPFVSAADGEYKPAFQTYIERIKAGETHVSFDTAKAHAAAVVARDAPLENSQADRQDSAIEEGRFSPSRQSDGSPTAGEEAAGVENGREKDDDVDEDEDDEDDNDSESSEGDEEGETKEAEKMDSGIVENRNGAVRPQTKAKTRRGTREEEEKELAKTMMTKRNRRLYERIEYGRSKRKAEAQLLEKKRARLEALGKKLK